MVYNYRALTWRSEAIWRGADMCRRDMWTRVCAYVRDVCV